MTIGDVGFASMSLTPRAINRATGRVSADVRRKLLVGDRIIVEGPRDDALLALQSPQSGFEAAFAIADVGLATRSVVDAMLMPGARWIGQTLNTVRAQLASDLSIFALHRRGQKTPALAGRMRLKVGDVMLVSDVTMSFNPCATVQIFRCWARRNLRRQRQPKANGP